MYRTDVSTAAPSLPTPAAPGTPGYFTGGSPGAVAPTVVDADFLNGVQEELMSILTAANVAPSKTTHNQVLTALQALFASLNAQTLSLNVATALTPAETGALVELTGGSTFTTSLPTPVGNGGVRYRIYNAGTVSQTLSTPAAEFAGTMGSGAATQSVAPGSTFEVESDGTNWLVVGSWVTGGGRLINVQVFTASGTYTPTPGTNSIVVDAQAGGGAGGGLAATGASTTGGSSGGTPGSYARARYTSGFAGAVVTIGSKGVGTVGGAGGAGGTTSFGALLSCPGGPGAPVGFVSSGAISVVGGTASSTPSGSGILFAGAGQSPIIAMQVSPGVTIAPNYTPSQIGGTQYGFGGGGIEQQSSQAAAAGPSGGGGVVIVYEYA
jgi:hypothetical protein